MWPIVANVTGVPPAILAGVIAAALGLLGGSFQHLLYRDPAFRAAPAGGSRRRVIQAGVALGAAATAAIAFRPDHYDPGPAALTASFCLVLAVLSSTDLERRLLPNRLMYPAILGAIAFAWAWPDRTAADVGFGALAAVAIAAGMFTVGLLVGAALRVNTSTFGLGDVKLILLMGLLCGWPALLSALFIGVIAAGIPSFVLLAQGKGRSVFSYGPFLAAGCIVVLLWPGRFV